MVPDNEQEKGQEVVSVPLSPSARSAALELGKGAHMIAEGVHLAHAGGLPLGDLARELSTVIAKEKLIDSLGDVGEKTDNERAKELARELRTQEISATEEEIPDDELDTEEKERLATLREIDDLLSQAKKHASDKEVTLGDIKKALSLFITLDEIDQSSVRHSIVSTYDACGLHQEAQDFVDQSKDQDPPIDWITDMTDRGSDAADKGDLARARVIAEALREKDHEKFSELMTGIAHRYAEQGNYVRAEQTIAEIVDRADNEPDVEWQGSGYALMVEAVARHGDDVQASKWIGDMRDAKLPHLFDAQRTHWVEQVRRDAGSLEDIKTAVDDSLKQGALTQGQYDAAMQGIAIALLETGHFELAKVAARKVTETYWKNDTFSKIALAQSDAGLIDQARMTIESISQQAQGHVLEDIAKDEIRHGVHRYLDAKAKLSALPPNDLAGLQASSDPKIQAVQRLLPF